MTALIQSELVDTDSPEWQQRGLCRLLSTVTVDDFYYESQFNGDTPQRREHVERLQGICAACPVQVECDEYADATSEPGFWAGIEEHERHLRKKRKQHAARRDRRAERAAARELFVLEFP